MLLYCFLAAFVATLGFPAIQPVYVRDVVILKGQSGKGHVLCG